MGMDGHHPSHLNGLPSRVAYDSLGTEFHCAFFRLGPKERT